MQYFEYFSKNDLNQVHSATLKVLETTGVDFYYPPALEILDKAGCRIEGQRVYFPADLVEKQVAKAPSQFTLGARDPQKDVIIGGDHIAFIPCYGPPFVDTLEAGRQQSSLTDFTNFVKLAHTSKYQDISGGVMAEPNDIAVNHRNAEMIYGSLRYSDKPFMGGAIGIEAARETIKMASMVFGDVEKMAEKPPFISILCSRTPLGFDDRMLGAIMEYAKAGMPQLISSLSIAGATAPVTMEGTLIVQNSDILAGMVLTQLVRAGAPVVFSGSSSAAAMRYGTLSVGAPEMAVNTAATAQMGRFYGIPSRSGGAVSDAKRAGTQAAFESMMSQMAAVVSGVNFVLHSAGILENYVTASYEKFIIDDEICGMCKRIKRGETASEEKLAVDLIQKVGPGGEFLTQPHTMQHFRQELYMPMLEERNNYEGWKKSGATPMVQRANARWKQILQDYTEPELPGPARQALDAYMATVRQN